MTFLILRPDGTSEELPIRKPADGFDYADRVGARVLRDQYRETFFKLEGEWFGVGNVPWENYPK